ncbi:hypothetical protein ZWY2020_040341 [Hordeum vulgare]|nr:hypothetical protein ZWY2020_040341 [Hordeum vulgare]
MVRPAGLLDPTTRRHPFLDQRRPSFRRRWQQRLLWARLLLSLLLACALLLALAGSPTPPPRPTSPPSPSSAFISKDGVGKHGAGKWCTILNDPEFGNILRYRSNVDLKDKWRNMNATVNASGSRDKVRDG